MTAIRRKKVLKIQDVGDISQINVENTFNKSNDKSKPSVNYLLSAEPGLQNKVR